MAATTVGIRELKAQLARYVRQVKAGGIVTITEKGKPIGRIIPVRTSTDERVQEMIRAGLAHWSGRKPKPMQSPPRTRGNRTVAELLLEDRE